LGTDHFQNAHDQKLCDLMTFLYSFSKQNSLIIL
jgi:hypothetical protein